MRRDEALLQLGEYAADQHGLVTAAQAHSLGIGDVTLLRLAQVGHLLKVGHGVYQLASAGDPTHLSVRVAWLRLDPSRPAWERYTPQSWGGVVSHASAAQVHATGDVPAERVELLTPTKRTTREKGVRLRTATVKENDVVVVEGLPVTTLVRTVVDLLAVHADGGHIGGVIADAEQRGLIDLQQLAERITPQAAELGFAGLDGHEVIEHLVEQAGRSLSAQIHDEQMRDVAALSSAMGAVAESLSTRFDLPYSAVVEALRESVLKQSTPGMSHLGATSELRRVRNALAHLAHTAPRMDPDLLVSLRDVLAHAVPRTDLYALAGLQGSLSSLPALRHAVLPSARPSSALASHRRAADSAHSGSYNQDGDGE